MKSRLSPLVRGALRFARGRHRGQRRKGDGRPFITHPMAVARLLEQWKMPQEVVAAGLLHDVLEDTDATAGELKARFGPGVTRLVRAVTDLPKRHSWEKRKAAYLARLRLAPREALAVSCADKIHNTLSLIEAYEQEGASIFARFRRPPAKKLAYHRQVERLIRRRWPACPGLPALARAAGRLEIIVKKNRNLSAHREIEVKYRVSRRPAWEALGRVRSLGPFRLKRRARQMQRNDYLDTRDLRLRRAGAALKVRRTGRRAEVTFKRHLRFREGQTAERVEVTVPVPVSRLTAFLRNPPAGCEPVRCARRLAGRAALKPVVTVLTDRRKGLFARGRQRLELALDEVRVTRGERFLSAHREAELENFTASRAGFLAARRALERAAGPGLRASRVSKYEAALRSLAKVRSG